MFVTSSKQYTTEELRKMLVSECKRSKKEYGYFFKEVSGGFTGTSRYTPNVFNIIPLVVYKVFTDDRPDELVKGVSLIGTPLAMFSEIKACGDKSAVFNGYCGAESGMIPVSTISPTMLVNKIETQRQIEVPKTKNQLPSPINSNK
jgi:predicted Zn-dependent protease